MRELLVGADSHSGYVYDTVREFAILGYHYSNGNFDVNSLLLIRADGDELLAGGSTKVCSTRLCTR